MMKRQAAAKNSLLKRIFGKNSFKYKHALSGYLFIAPVVILLTIFVVTPLIIAVWRSFYDYQSYADVQKFVAFDNYKYILQTPLFIKSILNVLFFAAIITVIMVILSFSFAHVLKRISGGLGSVAKTIIYIPYLISGIAASIIFLFMTNYGGGLINGILIGLDKDPISFVQNELWAKVAIIVPTLWLGFGYNSLVMYAGLLNIPNEYYEAAAIDGATWYHRLFKITLPGMTNSLLLIIVGLVCGGLQMFDIPFMMTGGAPQETTYTPVLYLFNSYRDPSRSDSVTIAGALLVMLIITTVNGGVFFSVHSKKAQDG